MFSGVLKRWGFKLGLGLGLGLAFSCPFACSTLERDVYIWGNGRYQARPDAVLQFGNFTPKLIRNLPRNMASIIFGPQLEAGLDTEHNLYVWSRHFIEGNLSRPEDEQVQHLRQVDSNVAQACFTQTALWTLKADGSVLHYDTKGGKDAAQLANAVALANLPKCRQIASGEDHVVFLTEEGEVFALGDNSQGQCGLPVYEGGGNHVGKPVKVENLPKIKKVAANGGFTLALGEDGHVYGWGSNSLLQLSDLEGYGNFKNPLVKAVAPSPFGKTLSQNRVEDIAVASETSFLLTFNKKSNLFEVFASGCNNRGEMGVGERSHLSDVTILVKLSNLVDRDNRPVTIKQLACGTSHCICRLSEPYVLSWGDNEFGQQGNGKRSQVISPTAIKMFSKAKIVGVFAGMHSSAVIVEVESTK